MHPSTHTFKENAKNALKDERLQKSLGVVQNFQNSRRQAIERLPEFSDLCTQAEQIKNHTIQHLDYYLEQFETRVLEQGGHVHWTQDSQQANQQVLELCQKYGVDYIVKGKSMVTEEIGLIPYLEQHNIQVIETDLGEYILQLRHESPSHIIVPSMHLRHSDVAETFRTAHTQFPTDRVLDHPNKMVKEARQVMRERFQRAQLGITGSNFMIAETGAIVMVTNEGNADLSQTLPRIHVVVTGIEKIVPTVEDAFALLRVLARSATGQDFSAYTTFAHGPRRQGDRDGPEFFHVILVDNGRSKLVGTEFQEVLRCIRCGACMNHCPVYGSIGGHAYGWVYPGPIGAVVTPALLGIEHTGHLPNASTLCGRCESVCPVRIPLPKLMRHWRQKEYKQKHSPFVSRLALNLWGWVARYPFLYHIGNQVAARLLYTLGRKKGSFQNVPLAEGWTSVRDLAVPEGSTFQQQYNKVRRK